MVPVSRIPFRAKGWDDAVRIAEDNTGKILISASAILEGKKRIENSPGAWQDVYETLPEEDVPVGVVLRDGSVRSAVLIEGGWFCCTHCMTPLNDRNLPEYWISIPESDVEEKHFSRRRR